MGLTVPAWHALRAAAEERLASPDLVTRVAARLDLIEANLKVLDESDDPLDDLIRQAKELPWWKYLAERRLLREARLALAWRQVLLDENKRLIRASQIDVFRADWRG